MTSRRFGSSRWSARQKLSSPRFQFQLGLGNDEDQTAEWIIEGVLPKAALGDLFGSSGSGKTFLALDMVAAISEGTDWRGLDVVRGRVAYICAEGASGFRKRLRALKLCVNSVWKARPQPPASSLRHRLCFARSHNRTRTTCLFLVFHPSAENMCLSASCLQQ